jgi:CheY-like chemotaxis protein
MGEPTILIVEDGDEYRDNLARFVPGPRYLQAHSGAEALRMLAAGPVDLVYLDMRFDRIPNGDLMGDHVAATKEHNGDPVRAWRHLQTNQGLYILEAMRTSGHAGLPVIVAYDFSRQLRRYERLREIHPTLRWVPDDVTPARIRALMEELLSR